MKSSFFTKVLTTSGFVLGAFALAAVAGTWTAPTDTPPNGNVDAPINVGDNLQTKLGSLWIKKGFEVDGNLIIASGTPAVGKVLTAVDSLGTAAWQMPTGGGGGSAVPHGIVVFSTAGSHTWVVPSGVTSAKVTVIGAGGDGGGSCSAPGSSACTSGAGGGVSQGYVYNIGGLTASISVGDDSPQYSNEVTARSSTFSIGANTFTAGGGANAQYSNSPGGISSGGQINFNGGPTGPSGDGNPEVPFGYSTGSANWGQGGYGTSSGRPGAVIIEY